MTRRPPATPNLTGKRGDLKPLQMPEEGWVARRFVELVNSGVERPKAITQAMAERFASHPTEVGEGKVSRSPLASPDVPDNYLANLALDDLPKEWKNGARHPSLVVEEIVNRWEKRPESGATGEWMKGLTEELRNQCREVAQKRRQPVGGENR